MKEQVAKDIARALAARAIENMRYNLYKTHPTFAPRDRAKIKLELAKFAEKLKCGY